MKELTATELQEIRRTSVLDIQNLCEMQGTVKKAEDIKFTCDICSFKNTCEFVYDGYNTNGDCLAEK